MGFFDWLNGLFGGSKPAEPTSEQPTEEAAPTSEQPTEEAAPTADTPTEEKTEGMQ